MKITSRFLGSVLIFCIVFLPLKRTLAQQDSAFSFHTDLVSSFVWRGLSVDNTPNIQPYITYEKSNFSATAWGSLNFDGTYSEADLILVYETSHNLFALTDYYIFPEESGTSYLDFSSETVHLIEAGWTYSLSEKIPLSLSLNTFVLGSDKDSAGAQCYSSYAELGYDFMDFHIFLGYTPWAGLYSEKSGICNAGLKWLKEIRVTDSFSFPAFIVFQINPLDKKTYLFCGFTL